MLGLRLTGATILSGSAVHVKGLVVVGLVGEGARMDVGGGMNISMRCRGNCGGTAEQRRPIRSPPFAHWRTGPRLPPRVADRSGPEGL